MILKLPELTDSAKQTMGYIQGYGRGFTPRDLSPDTNLTPYRVGFEVEKTKFKVGGRSSATSSGDMVGYQDLFATYETDSSCGVEAITNILPLSTRTDIQDSIKQLMDQASDVINSPASSRCGGHITSVGRVTVAAN